MGLSFSGLSLVAATGAELGVNAEVGAGVGVGTGSGPRHRAAALTGDGPAANRKGGLSDLDPDTEAVLYPGVDGQPPHSRDLPPQASPFLAVWSSAVGWTDPEVSVPVPEAPSILASENPPVGHGASLERPAGLLALSREAFEATAAAKLSQAPEWIAGAPAAGQGAAVERNPMGAEPMGQPESPAASAAARLLQQVPGSAARPDPDGPANGRFWEKPGVSDRIDHAQQGFSTKTAGLPQAARQQADSAAAALTEHIARTLPHQEFTAHRAASDELRENRAKENSGAGGNHAAAKQHPVPENTANVYALPATADAAAEAPRSGAAAPASGRPANSPLLSQTLSDAVEVSPKLAAEGQAAYRSEVAFQAELRLQNQPAAPDAAPADHRSANGRLPGPNSARPETALRQSPDAAGSLQELEGAQREAFRRMAGESGPKEPSAQGHAGAGRDHGMRQPTPVAPGTAASQPVTSTPATPQQPAVPAAARLDALPPDAPAEVSSPARSLAFKVHGEDGGAANVILTDRGGQVHVTVRSSDPALTQSLRSDLGSLSGSFQRHGFDVKLWNPSSGSSAGGDTQSNSFDFGQDDLRGHARQRHFFDDARQQRRQAEWPEEID